MFQFYIKQFGLSGNVGYPPTGYADPAQGNNNPTFGNTPFQLTLRCIGTSAASERNVWVKNYATLAAAKTGAVAGVSGGALPTPTLDTTSGTWTDNATSTESLSVTFTLPF